MINTSNKYLNTKTVESGIYIHVPFCRKKCLYCDFFSGGARQADWRRYLAATLNELRQRIWETAVSVSLAGATSCSNAVDTLYIGGGTPSLIPIEMFENWVGEINRIVGKAEPWREFTLEVNPEDVSDETCKVWLKSGVNRISMGIQSLNDEELRKIGRSYDSRVALSALKTLQRYFRNVTIDLIFGLPGQTLESWRKTIEVVLSYRPQHISAYSLMFEEGTAMTLLRDQGKMQFPEEEECVMMWKELKKLLEDAGYRQYELSNYSLPGFEAIHNKRYWLGNPYLGIGPSAHSYEGGSIRRSNPNDIAGYMERYAPKGENSGVENAPGTASSSDAGKTSYYMEEKLTEEELMEEKIMLSLRMARGLDLDEFRNKFGSEITETVLRKAQPYIVKGELVKEDGFLRLTDSGVMLADDIIVNICP